MLPSSFRVSKKDPLLSEVFRNGKKYSLGAFGYVRFLQTQDPLRVLCLVGRFFDNRAVVRNTFRRRVYAAVLSADTRDLRGVLVFHAPKKEVQGSAPDFAFSVVQKHVDQTLDWARKVKGF